MFVIYLGKITFLLNFRGFKLHKDRIVSITLQRSASDNEQYKTWCLVYLQKQLSWSKDQLRRKEHRNDRSLHLLWFVYTGIFCYTGQKAVFTINFSDTFIIILYTSYLSVDVSMHADEFSAELDGLMLRYYNRRYMFSCMSATQELHGESHVSCSSGVLSANLPTCMDKGE